MPSQNFEQPPLGKTIPSTFQAPKATDLFTDDVLVVVKAQDTPKYKDGVKGDPHPDTKNYPEHRLQVIIPDGNGTSYKWIYVRIRDPLVSYEGTGEGLVQTVTKSRVRADADKPELSALIVGVRQENLADGDAELTVTEDPRVFPATEYSVEIPDLVPAEFRDQVPLLTATSTKAGEVFIPTLLPGELAKSVKEVTDFRRRDSVTARNIDVLPKVLVDKELAGISAHGSEFGGKFDIVKTLDRQDLDLEEGFGIISSRVKQLGGGLTQRETEQLSTLEAARLELTAGGAGYSDPPEVIFTDGEAGHGAAGIAILTATPGPPGPGGDPGGTFPLTFSTYGDANGVFYFLGSRYTTNHAWANPSPNVVQLSSASNDAFPLDETDLRKMIDRASDNVLVIPREAGGHFVGFNLGTGRLLAANLVTIRTGSAIGQIHRHARIEGTRNSGASWTNLGEIALHAAGGWAQVGLNDSLSYQAFRIYGIDDEIGDNDPRTWPALAIDEVEFYGQLTIAATTGLNYQSNGDANGVFYFLGQRAGSGTWTNPHTAGAIVASADDFTGGSTAAQLVDRVASNVTQGAATGNSFTFDLTAGRSLLCNKLLYRQRTGSNGSPFFDFQGSNDGSSWTTLTSFSANPDSGKWHPIDVATATFYRYFRLHSTHPFFCAGEVELYGELNLSAGGGTDATFSITGVQITDGGEGYGAAPQVSFSGDGDGATGTAVIQNGEVIRVDMTEIGSGYTTADVNFLVPGGGSGAAATAVIDAEITELNLTDNGSGYDTIPDVVFTPPSTSAANAVLGYTLASVEITNQGSGYASAPGCVVTPDMGSDTTVVLSKALASIAVTLGGSGYGSAPTVNIDPPTGINPVQATATAVLGTGGGGGGNDPGTMANLEGWFKASDFDAVTDATEIATWVDQSPALQDLTAINGAGNRPVVNRNAIDTTGTTVEALGGAPGTAKGLQNTSYPGGSSWTIFSVLRYTESSPSSRRDFFGWGTGTGGNGWNVGVQTNNKLHVHDDGVAEHEVNETISDNVYHSIIVANNAGTITIYLDGVTLTWSGSPPAATTNAIYQILSGETNFLGDMAEFAIFSRNLSPTERTDLDDYVTSQYLGDPVDSVASVTITNGGSGYLTTPGVSFTGTHTVLATATGTLASTGKVDHVTIDDPGEDFETTPGITFDSGAAAGTAHLSTTGRVIRLDITDDGGNYQIAPDVDIVPTGTGSGAAATAVVEGSVVSLTLDDSGTGYFEEPTIKIFGHGGTGATASLDITPAGEVTNLQVLTGGSGFNSAPDVAIKAVGGPEADAFLGFAVDHIDVDAHGGGFAQVILTSDGTNPTSGNTLTIDGDVYVFRSSLTFVGKEIKLGGTAAITLDRIKEAVNYTGSPGVNYNVAGPHPTVRATTNTNTTQVLAARVAGVEGNSIHVSEASSHLSLPTSQLTGGGVPYTSPPAIHIQGPATDPASAIAVLGYPLDHVIMVNRGEGYSLSPAIHIGGDGSDASGSGVIGFQVASTTVTNGGSNYLTEPAVVVSGGGSFGAEASFAARVGRPVDEIFLGGAGAGYTSTPTVVFTPPSGGTVATAATATATRSFAVDSITGGTGGTLYTTATVTIDPPTGLNGIQATAMAVILLGVIDHIDIIEPGFGYLSAPGVVVTGDGSGASAATAVLETAGPVDHITLTGAGTGYSNAPFVTFSGGSPTLDALAGCTLDVTVAGPIARVEVLNPGYGYTSTVFLTIPPGTSGGTGATATATLSTSGQIVAVVITDPGSGYTVNANVSIVGNGTGAFGIAYRATAGSIKRIDLLHAGAGYEVAPTVNIDGGGGTGGAATAVLANLGSVVRLVLTNPGPEYTIAPLVSFIPDGLGAAALYILPTGWPILTDFITDPVEGIVVEVIKKIVPAGHARPSGYVDVYALDKYRSIQITSRVDPSTLPAPDIFTQTHVLSLPPLLISVFATYGQDRSVAASIDTRFGSTSVKSSARGKIVAHILDGYRGPSKATVTRTFLPRSPQPELIPEPLIITPATGTAYITSRSQDGSNSIGIRSGFGYTESQRGSSEQVDSLDISGVLTGGYGNTSQSPINYVDGVAISNQAQSLAAAAGMFIDPFRLHLANTAASSFANLVVDIPSSCPPSLIPGTTFLLSATVEKWRFGIYVLTVTSVTIPIDSCTATGSYPGAPGPS